MPVLVRPVDKDSELIATSLLDMSLLDMSLLEMANINSGLTAEQMYDMCNEVREMFSLDWDNCMTYF